MPVCQAVTFAQIQEPVYQRIAAELHNDWREHRKSWEWAYILRALELEGLLQPGSRGIGYGVGQEPLAAALAARGCRVTATDLPEHDDGSAVWAATGQHASALAALNQHGICEPEQFAALVELRPLNMNRLPKFDGTYDFAWSSCVIEHVGSAEASARFLLDSMSALRQGGVAVHTTELCVVDVVEPIETIGTTVFSQPWLREMKSRLEADGHEVAALNFNLGSQPQDALLDVPPYTFEHHLKLVLNGGVATTSFGLIIRAGARSRAPGAPP